MGRCGRMHIEFSKEHISEYCRMNQFMFDLFLKHKEELEQVLRDYPQYLDELNGWMLEYTEFTP